MGHQPQHGGVFSLDSTSGGSLVDYSSDARGVTLPNISNNMNQYHTIDSRTPKTTIGGFTGSFTVEVVRDPDPTSLHRVLLDWITENPPVARSVQLDLPDSAVGSERHTAEVHLQSYTPGQGTGGSGEPATGTATLMIAGTYTISTIV